MVLHLTELILYHFQYIKLKRITSTWWSKAQHSLPITVSSLSNGHRIESILYAPPVNTTDKMKENCDDRQKKKCLRSVTIFQSPLLVFKKKFYSFATRISWDRFLRNNPFFYSLYLWSCEQFSQRKNFHRIAELFQFVRTIFSEILLVMKSVSLRCPFIRFWYSKFSSFNKRFLEQQLIFMTRIVWFSNVWTFHRKTEGFNFLNKY